MILFNRKLIKHLLIFASLIVCISYAPFLESKVIPNGRYRVALDQNYKDIGLNDFEITIQDTIFQYKMFENSESLELVWISDSAFIVKGFTEPKNIKNMPEWMDRNDKQAFHITKHEAESYYFHLGTKNDDHPILQGKLITIKKQ